MPPVSKLRKLVVEIDLSEIENEFRQSWRHYDPSRYEVFLRRADDSRRAELLTRLLSAELEFSYQPPEPEDDAITKVVDSLDQDDQDARIRPTLQLFLLRFRELKQHTEALIRLSVLEYALRLRHDQVPPNPDSYLEYCEQSADRLLKLLELTERKLPLTNFDPLPTCEVSASDSTVNESSSLPSIPVNTAPHNLGCFLLLRLIGKGGMGYVYSAIDLRSTAQVAVKVMRRVDSWSVYRFVEEFTWLSKLNHPNLIRLYDAFHESDVRYFSMELVDGQTIRRWFQDLPADNPNRWALLTAVLEQAAQALHFLHTEGVIHCDIKCSNLMITPRRRAVLLDLGLAVREGNLQSLVGTLQYMAPELLNRGCPTRASDWYGLGMLMYEVMLDQYPPIRVNVSAEDPSERYQIDEAVLRENLAQCDPELAELCVELLSVEPASRPSGEAVLRRLDGDNDDPIVGPKFDQFYGRESEISLLNELHRPSLLTPCKVVLVRGDRGIGKTATVRQWLASLPASEEIVLDLHCHQQDHTPRRLFNRIIQELTAFLPSLPKEIWLDALKQQANLLGEAYPQILQAIAEYLPDDPDGSQPESPKAEPDRIEIGLLNLLVDLSKRSRLLITIDDAHWADLEGLLWLTKLVATKNFQGTLIVIDQDSPSWVYRTLHNAIRESLPGELDAIWSELAIDPLPLETCGQLVDQWSQSCNQLLPESTKADILDRAAGNPFLLQELFQAHFQHRQKIVDASDSWLEANASHLTLQKFSSLSARAETVLQFLAVAEEAIGFHQLQIATRMMPQELQQTLVRLVAEGWIRSRSNSLEGDWEIGSESFRRIIKRAMPRERLHRRHVRLARMLSSETPPPWSRMANHYWECEHFREAAACYFEAARVAAKSAQFGDAVFFLSRAEHQTADRSPREREDLMRLKADCLAGHGSSQDAAELYDQLSENAADNEAKLLNQCLAGEQYIRAGQLQLGLRRLRTVLQRLGITNVQYSKRAQLAVRLRTLKHAVLDTPQDAKQSGDGNRFNALNESLNRISIPLTFLDNQLGPDVILRLKKLGQQTGDHEDRSLALTNWALLLSLAGRTWRPKALHYVRETQRLASLAKGPAARAQIELFLFIWHTQKGDFSKALKHSERSIELFQRGPRTLQWEMQFLNWGKLGSHWYLCEIQELSQLKLKFRESATHRSDSMSLFFMNVAAAHWADLAVGNKLRAREALETAASAISNQAFATPRFFLWLSRVQQALYEGQSLEAKRILEQDWSQLAKAYVMSTNHYRWLALCIRLCCDLACTRDDPPRRAAYLKDARSCLKQLRKLKEPKFAVYSDAFKLVVDAAEGSVAEPQQWQKTVDLLHQYQHHLYGYALQWHQSEYDPNNSQPSVQQTMTARGCVDPETLLEVLFPLPRRT